VRAAELPGTLPVSTTIAAGAFPRAPLEAGRCARIMTGAPLPEGADTVVMREDVEDRGDEAVFVAAPRIGQHVRRRGEDVAQGSAYLQAGARIGYGELALLAAQSQSEVPVRKRPRVAVLSTGDELVPPGRTPGKGQIVNTNNLVLCEQVRSAGGVAVDAGIVADDRRATERALRSLADYDVLLTSGGVSVGDFDFVKDAFQSVGIGIDFWKVAVKPGKPLAFGQRGSQLVFGLPGNPVSSLVSFELFVRPVLRSLQGEPEWKPQRISARLAEDVRKRPGRAHYLRCSLSREAGEFWARPASSQGSGSLTSIARLDGLIELSAEGEGAARGDTATVILVPAPVAD
jgi:molybdopterin molybdotransferase